MTCAALSLLLTLLAVHAPHAACAPPLHPIVTEVYYDAAGDDTGWEFVELHNPLERAVALAGVRLEAGDGAAPGRWTTRWTGAEHDSIRAGERFVIGGAKLAPPPDALVTLELQNGPDGMRLVWPDGASETVGWGALAHSEYACGTPAPDVPSGQSLSRVPDDADLGDNALDFRAAEPSPGRANQPPVDLAVAHGSLTVLPENPAPGEALRFTVGVHDRGAQPLAAGGGALLLSGDALADTLALALPALAPGETLVVAAGARAGARGRRTLVARVSAPGDGVPGNDADTLAVRVGPGPLEVTEIQFHPGFGEGEWVEVRNRSGGSLALSDFTLSDRGDGRARVEDAVELAPDSLALLAQDRPALLAAFAQVDATRVAGVAAWPSLNNTNGADGIADLVVLRESDGLASDRVAYSASGVPAGATLEKSAGSWRVSGAGQGTPLAPPREAPSGAAQFSVEPRRIALSSPETRLSWRLPWPRARVSAVLYDMEGRRVAQLLSDVDSAGSGERTVRLDGAGPGFFAVVLRARADREELTRTALLRIAGPRP